MKTCTSSLALVLFAAWPSILLAQTDQQPKAPSEAYREQQTAPTAPADQATPAAPDAAAALADPAANASGASTEQLEQLVAPIALYPDALLAQLMMAATYPLEIVEASRWVQKNPKITVDKLEAALQDQTWDPSVKSLCGFPDVLKRMNENLDWTQALGDAFLGQKAELMDAVQNMRRKAYDAGNLKSGKEQTITEREDKIIVIESAQPEVIYVPTYYPTAVYGGWGYPTYYYPAMYPPPPAGAAFVGFAAGMVWGAAIWGGCSWGWGHTDVDIDINRQNNFINHTEIDARRQEVKNRAGSGTTNQAGISDRAGNKGTWNHDPSHRKGVGYKDGATAQKYGGSQGQNRVSRDQARGYGERTAPRPSTGGAGASTRPGGASSARPSTTPSTRPSTSNGQAGPRPSTAATPRTTGQSSSSFTGARNSSLDRASSARGSSSRASAGSRGSGGRSGGGGRGGRR